MNIGKKTSSKNAVLRFAGFELDSRQRLLINPQGEPVSLTSRGFDTLLFLIEHRGETVSKQQIMEAVWPNSIVEENNLTQAISAVRRALDDHQSKQKIIVTVAGRGYSFASHISTSIKNKTSITFLQLGFGSLILALGFTAFSFYSRPEPELDKSIAVLPFIDLSPNGDQGYFADGLTEEILNRLANIDGLQVSARTSSFYFKERKEPTQKIGEQLKVSYLLEGSVRKSGNHLRITAQLIKANDGFHLWSETYDRELSDIFSIQNEMSERVATVLSLTLGTGRFSQAGSTRNIEAYDFYLRARDPELSLEPYQIRNRIDLAQQAVNLDPDSSLLWLLLRSNYLNGYGFLPKSETLVFQELAQEALDRARKLDPESLSLVFIDAEQAAFDGNLSKAERMYKGILEQEPNNLAALGGYGKFLLAVGRVRERLEIAQRVSRMDPLSVSASKSLAYTYLYLGMLAEAQSEAERYLSLGGNEVDYMAMYLGVFIESDDYDEIESFLYNRSPLGEGEQPPLIKLTLQLLELQRMDDRQQALAELKILGEGESTPWGYFTVLALWALELGDPELALEIRVNELGRTQYSIWGRYADEMRLLPGFKAYVESIGLLSYWRESSKWGDYCRPLGGNDFECR